MSDELRAAAERWRVHIAREEETQSPYYSGRFAENDERHIQLASDLRKLADAYLAEHDPTPITQDWLLEIGFREYFCNENTRGLSFVVNYHSLVAVMWPLNGGEFHWSVNLFSMLKTGYPKTRGDVRRLLSALGVK